MNSTRRILFAAGAGMLGIALLAGALQSLRAQRSLPAIDLFAAGSNAYIDRLIANADYDGAIDQLRMQSRFLPLDAAPYENLGNVLGSQGRAEEARTQFEQLVRLRPEYAEGYNLLGSTYLDTGQPDVAAGLFVQALRLKSEFPLALNGLGVALSRMGDFAQAERCFAKAVKLAPDFEAAAHNLHEVRRNLKPMP